eukprot:1845594-Lingulodinium_polyedra.AAC.1
MGAGANRGQYPPNTCKCNREEAHGTVRAGQTMQRFAGDYRVARPRARPTHQQKAGELAPEHRN